MAKDNSSDGAPSDLLADQAHGALADALRTGRLTGGQFVSMPELVNLLDLPLSATREAVKRAEAYGLVVIVPKRGVKVMNAGPEVTCHCMDLREILDKEGARRLIRSRACGDLSALRQSHLEIRQAAAQDTPGNLSPRAIETDLSLHNFLATGLQNPVAERSYDVNRIRIAIIQNSRPFLRNRIASAMDEHLAIIDALEAFDTAGSVEAIETHYKNTLEWWGIA